MKLLIFLMLHFLIMTNCNTPSSNSNEENRIQTALTKKSDLIKENLTIHHLESSDLNILFVAYKDLDRLDLFAKSSIKETYKLINQYKICARSGKLGPKKAEGDKQVPEGFYYINRFNPKSNYYLSLGLNYPNAYDLAHNYTGSDIFIHGKCETVGCLPMTDDYIKEIYLYALWAKESGQQQIPVYIFPFEMTEENMLKYQSQVEDNTFIFWKNLSEGYKIFQENYKELNISVVDNKYKFTF